MANLKLNPTILNFSNSKSRNLVACQVAPPQDQDAWCDVKYISGSQIKLFTTIATVVLEHVASQYTPDGDAEQISTDSLLAMPRSCAPLAGDLATCAVRFGGVCDPVIFGTATPSILADQLLCSVRVCTVRVQWRGG
ncbi:hypothetical protein MKZ38_002198 [Zalerion maritima]|uniref:Uncharacterized protein n=1 Tax=Zalerion maritima TaxID=339359 RepID=A0AAD5RP91_9PEZI|nr:hypothetical protein MKZ38_002198 [Zalerion maritima]